MQACKSAVQGCKKALQACKGFVQVCMRVMQGCKKVVQPCKRVVQGCNTVLQGCKDVLQGCKGVVQACNEVMQGCKRFVQACKRFVQGCRKFVLTCISFLPCVSKPGGYVLHNLHFSSAVIPHKPCAEDKRHYRLTHEIQHKQVRQNARYFVDIKKRSINMADAQTDNCRAESIPPGRFVTVHQLGGAIHLNQNE